MTEGEQARFRVRSTDSLDAWVLAERARALTRRLTPEDAARAEEFYSMAVATDPDFAVAWHGLDFARFMSVRLGWSENPEQDFQKAFEAAERSFALDPEQPDTLAFLGMLHLYRRNHAEAIELGRKAIALGPNMADSINSVADILRYSGEPLETISLVQKAMRLNPRFPDYYLYVLGVAQHHQGVYSDSVSTLGSLIERNPAYPWAALSS